MTMIRPLGDLDVGDHISIGDDHESEIAPGSYTVAAFEALDAGRVRLELTPDGGGNAVTGSYDGRISVGVS